MLVEFSEPLDDELQAVLVYSCDVPRVMALAVEVGIYAAPAYESLLAASEAGDDWGRRRGSSSGLRSL